MHKAEWKDIGHWLRHGIWALLDQSLFALSNFLINLCLARWLTPSEYGVFATVFMVLLMFGTFHSALITEPMVVFSTNTYKARFSEYAGMVFYGHWIFTILFSCLCLLAGAIAWHQHSYTLAFSVVGLALASPMVLYQWLARRVSYIKFKTYLASCAGVLYLVLMSIGTFALYQYRWITGTSILLLMGVASLCSGLWLLARFEIWDISANRDLSAREVLINHWEYGKWMVGTNLMSWAFGNAFFLLLPIFAGLEETGAARALFLIFMPIFLVITATNHLLLPFLVKIRTEESFSRMVRNAATYLTLAATGYSLMIGIFSDAVINFFFDGQYIQHAKLLWILGMLSPLLALAMVLGVGIRAIDRPERHFASFVQCGYIALPVGFLLTGVWGLLGAVVATVFAHTILALSLLTSYNRLVGARAFSRKALMCPSVEIE